MKNNTTAEIRNKMMSKSRNGWAPSHSTRAVIYTETPKEEESVMTIADDWFNEKKIYNLDFKCKTWNKVLRKCNRAVNAAIKEILSDVKSIHYSRNAGCSCGCSPGHIVKFDKSVDFNDAWAVVKTSKEDCEEFRAWLKTLDEELAAEIIVGNEQVVQLARYL
jgi:hypothetical protein